MVTAAAVAVKVAVVAVAGTATDGGTVSAEVRLLDRPTVEPVAGAGAESVTVQVVEVEAARVMLPQAREEMVIGAAGAVMEIARGLLEEPREAVTVDV